MPQRGGHPIIPGLRALGWSWRKAARASESRGYQNVIGTHQATAHDPRAAGRALWTGLPAILRPTQRTYPGSSIFARTVLSTLNPSSSLQRTTVKAVGFTQLYPSSLHFARPNLRAERSLCRRVTSAKGTGRKRLEAPSDFGARWLGRTSSPWKLPRQI